MHKRRLLNLMIFTCLIIAVMFLGVNLLMKKDMQNLEIKGDLSSSDENTPELEDVNDEDIHAETNPKDDIDFHTSEPWLRANPFDQGKQIGTYGNIIIPSNPLERTEDGNDLAVTNTTGNSLLESPDWELITDSKTVDYMAYIPQTKMDSVMETQLNIENPSINIDAKAAILFDANTKEVLFYKNPVEAAFPASTAKLLTALVALDWCNVEEEICIGDEIKMIGFDSTRAYLDQGEVLTLQNLLEGMLLPSGNDAAYSVAVYVGRKSLENSNASNKEALLEFVSLMNEKAADLGAKNSCFKTPDGYDAFGQYTTAYDMGLIGVEAAQNETIITISNKVRSRNIFVSGEDVTWENTNRLINRYSGQYYSKALGLKTGTSTMAGRCLISAAKEGDKEVVCVIMDSSSAGRWEDAIKLLKYGLN